MNVLQGQRKEEEEEEKKTLEERSLPFKNARL